MEVNNVPLLFAINTTFALPSNTLNEMPVAPVIATTKDVQNALNGNARNTVVPLRKNRSEPTR